MTEQSNTTGGEVTKLYAERDHEAQGEWYMRHLSAMTGERLHDKSAIAAELAHRDIQIEHFEAERDELVIDKTNLASANELLREENARLKANRPVVKSLLDNGQDMGEGDITP